MRRPQPRWLLFSRNESRAEPSLPIAVYYSCLWVGVGCQLERFWRSQERVGLEQAKKRRTARNTGAAGAEDASARADPRLRDYAAHPAGFQRCLAGRGRVAVPGAAPDGAGGLDQRRVANV